MTEVNNPSIRSELADVLGGAILVAAGMLLSVGVNVVARAVFARAYHPELYGVFSLSFTLLLICSMVATLGLRTGLPRQIAFNEANGDNAAGEVGSQILWALILTGALGATIGGILVQYNWHLATGIFHDPNYARPISMVAVAIPLLTLVRVISAVFRGFSRPHERVVFQGLLRNVGFLALLSVVVAIGLDHLTAIAMLPLSLAITTTLYVSYLYYDNPGNFRDNVFDRLGDIGIPVSLVRFSYPLMFSTLLMQLMTWMDILMLGYFASSEMVGLYDGVRPLVRVIPIVWKGMLFMYVPLVSGLYATDRLDAIRRVYFVLTKWFASATVPLTLIFLFFPKSSLSAVFGPTFVAAAPALQLLAVAFCLGNIIGPTGATLIAMGRTRVVMLINLMAAVVNFVLNVGLIPTIGLFGAAVGTAVALIFRNLLRLAVLYYLGRVHAVKSELLTPCLSTGVIVPESRSSSVPSRRLDSVFSWSVSRCCSPLAFL